MVQHYSQEFKDKVRQRHKTGAVSYRELALESGASYASVYQWCNPEKQQEALKKLRARTKTAEYKDRYKKYRIAWYTKNKNYKLERNKQWQNQNPIRYWSIVACASARKRAVKKSLPFSITIDDIVSMYPKDGRCPIFKDILTPFAGYAGRLTSPSLDRVIPSLGYVPGNIAVISVRANQTKNAASIEDLLKIVDWIREFIGDGVCRS